MVNDKRFLQVMKWGLLGIGVLLFMSYAVLCYLELFGVLEWNLEWVLFGEIGIMSFLASVICQKNIEYDELYEQAKRLQKELAKYKSAETHETTDEK